MAATIVTQAQTVQIDGVYNVMVTPSVQDPDAGDYVREIRIFGTPPAVGVTPPLVMTLRIRDADLANIAITVPSSEF